MLNYLKREGNVAYTENGAKVHSTTSSALLDFFAQGGAMRERSDSEIVQSFSKAFAENELLALKAAFYFRDIRGGQGERRTFRAIMKHLAEHHTERLKLNLHLIPHFGRWDDLYILFYTKLHYHAIDMIAAQLKDDLDAKMPSLLAKWLKSENTSSEESRELAKATRKALNLSSQDYRIMLSFLRKKINIVERLMSAGKWTEIEYSKIPSIASKKYRAAFAKRDTERYDAFINAVKKGEAKINTATLYPYEIVRDVMTKGFNETLELMWQNLPDYVGEKKENSIAVVDTSGSMNGLPIQVALSIGLYLAERNTGVFHNHFITFSEIPTLQAIIGKSLYEKITNMNRAHWDVNTNVIAVFRLILNTALKYSVPQNEMPAKLYIISDMQFDRADRNAHNQLLFDSIRNEFEILGYTMPKLVFWNVNARTENYPATMFDGDVQLVSGCSPSLFLSLMKEEFVSPYELMLEVLNGQRYEVIV